MTENNIYSGVYLFVTNVYKKDEYSNERVGVKYLKKDGVLVKLHVVPAMSLMKRTISAVAWDMSGMLYAHSNASLFTTWLEPISAVKNIN